MIDKTPRKWLSLVFALALPSSAAWSKEIAVAEMLVTISVHNDAGISAGTLRGAEMEASRVFRQSGIEAKWLNCPLPADGPEDPAQCRMADFPEHLQLRIARRSRNLSEITFGISYLSADGSGCYANLFYERIEEMQERSRVNLASLLGDVAAHEIGHLLLGTNSHAANGIMRARWESEELGSISMGTLFFSDVESRQMRSKLATWQAKRKDDSRVASARLGD
ncbi:MAG: hypothetical protein WBB89_15190 [Candidatus Acidiferrum sp.]